jgi:hypothetical protein
LQVGKKEVVVRLGERREQRTESPLAIHQPEPVIYRTHRGQTHRRARR